jgi:hypothetical protein
MLHDPLSDAELDDLEALTKAASPAPLEFIAAARNSIPRLIAARDARGPGLLQCMGSSTLRWLRPEGSGQAGSHKQLTSGRAEEENGRRPLERNTAYLWLA